MDTALQADFITKWDKYFKGAELPFVFFYSDDDKYARHMVEKRG